MLINSNFKNLFFTNVSQKATQGNGRFFENSHTTLFSSQKIVAQLHYFLCTHMKSYEDRTNILSKSQLFIILFNVEKWKHKKS